MKAGSIIVDLAADRGAIFQGRHGGNCPLTEVDRVTVRNGATLIGHTNFASMLATDASELYARNLLFLRLITGAGGGVEIDLSDDIVATTLFTRNGEVLRVI